MKKRFIATLCALLLGASMGLTGCSFSFDSLLGGDSSSDDASSGSNGSGNSNTTNGNSGSIWDNGDTGDTGGSGNSGSSSGGIWDSGDTSGSTDTTTPLPAPVVPDTSSGVELPVEIDFAPQPLEEQYGYRYFYALEDGEKFCRFYYDLYTACCNLQYEDVAAETYNVEDSEGNVSQRNLYIAATLNWAQYGLTQDEAIAVWKTARMEFPEFYWIDNEVTCGQKTLNVQIYEEYALGETRRALQTELEGVANACLDYLTADMSTVEIALTVYDYVVDTLQYAYVEGTTTPSEETWAHNIVGIIDGKGVCETYAKAYEYLLSLVGVETLTVSGAAGTGNSSAWELHAWNIVHIDGVWYTVDATWGDQQDTNGYIDRDWFGKDAASFATTHIFDPSTVAYSKAWQYEMPTLSDIALTPVRMAETEGETKLYANLDGALADIQNGTGTYTLALVPDTTVTAKTEAKVYLNKVYFAGGSLPEAATISLLGATTLGGTKTTLSATSSVTLHSNLYLQDIKYSFTIRKNGYTLSTN